MCFSESPLEAKLMKFKYWILVLLVLVIVLSGCPFQNKLPFWTSIPDITKDVGDSISFSLAAYCSDPDGDPLTFSIAGGPGSIVGENYTWTVALPQGERLVAVSASDGKSSSTKSFKIIVKTQPNVPSSPCPNYGASEIPYASVYLSWTGGDPDGDSVTYDLYFGTSGNPPLYASNLTSATYNKTGLLSYTTYYWKIVAKDGVNTTTCPIWVFTTKPYTIVNDSFESRPLGNLSAATLPWATYTKTDPRYSYISVNLGYGGSKGLTFVDSNDARNSRISRNISALKKGTV